MPYAPKRPCLGSTDRPRCPALVSGGGRCEECARVFTGARHKRLDARRGTAQERGYDYRWSQASKRHLAAYPLCGDRGDHAYVDGWRGECYGRRLTAAECTDHIRPPKGDRVLFWDPRNWQSLCANCNRIKGIRYEGGFGREAAC